MIRRHTLFLASFALLALLAAPSPPPAASAGAANTPASRFRLALWSAGQPIPENPVFTGTGRDTWDRKIRERGYILAGDDGNYDLWYTGYAGDRPATMSLGHATSPDGIHWTRDPGNPDIRRILGRRHVRRAPGRHVFHGRRGERTTSPTS